MIDGVMSIMKHRTIVGAHTSAAGGVYTALERAHGLSIAALQMFGSSPKQYKVKFPSEDDVKRFFELREEYAIQHIFLHAPYLVNLASEKPFVRHMSREALAGHLQIADTLEADGVIFHIGSVGVAGNKEEGIERVVKGIERAYGDTDHHSLLIIENSSGGGGKLGTTIHEMAQILDGVSRPVGVCLDTAHLYGAGVLDFTESHMAEFFQEWDARISPSALKVMHINDSRGALGSFLDRHENIGEGYIGEKGFVSLATYEQVRAVPWILEVPGFAGEGPDAKNVAILNRIVQG